jgi:hypothetical protein
LSAAASATRTDWYALTAVLDRQRGQAAIVCFSIRAANPSGRGCTAVDIISTKKKEEGAFRFPGVCLIRSFCGSDLLLVGEEQIVLDYWLQNWLVCICISCIKG